MQPLLPRDPPTDEERQLYYKGLPSRPILVARSSTHDWVNIYSFDRIRYMYSYADPNLYVLRPVGSYPHLHRLWNDASSSLRVQILRALSRANWTAIDILRVCINGKDPITLMVAVTPGSLTWIEGYAIARECKSIFARYGIFLDCEIRESVVTFCTADALETSSTTDASVDSSADSTNKTGTPKTFQLFSGPMPENDHWMYATTWTNFSDVLGTTIAIKHRDSLTGTKGLYLSLSPSSPGAESKILALSCRHVVVDSKTESGLETYYRPESAPFKDVVQVDQPYYEYMVKSLEHRISSYRKDSKHFFNGWIPCSPCAENALSLQQAITPFDVASSRVFGQLLYLPELNTTATEPEAQWSRDWALIELLPGSHQSPLSLIKNKVDIGSAVDFLAALFGRKQVVMNMKAEYGCQTMQSSVVPIDQIFKSDCTAEDESMMVIKYGLRGTFTLGLGNTLKSIVRHPETPGGVKRESEAWGIVSVVPTRVCLQEPFSIPGDSGACVWDMERRPAGMITAGSGSPEQVYDITYAQPLEGILEDMKSCGYDVSVV
ncbi:hypothetical protein THAR02_09525 [Trichoderma harzianum]|uniref:Uncharacterized protein n=1 Tax=Trichoderma harzianum TaxID=5544 RepID=A0A0F9X101_TRIHA|nr:hypothetical protein THAR02_09525 [Trichoderma harzianum]